jgi:twinkle protein
MANRVGKIDLDAYLMAAGEFSAYAKRAKEYADLLHKELDPAKSERTTPSMFSTKLRDRMVFRSSGTTAWCGYSGHRKSMFVGQVAADLCMQRQRVLIVSLEMRPEVTLARIARQMSGTKHPSREWLDEFLAWSNQYLWLFDFQGRLSPKLACAACAWFADTQLGHHVVLDSMMMVCESEEHLDVQKQLATDLVRLAQETFLHVHLVAHCRKPADGQESKPPSKHDLRGSAAITDQMDNVITVWANKPKQRKLEADPNDMAAINEPDALVTVEKQRAGSWEGRVKLWFDEASLRFCDDRTSSLQPYPMRKE